MRAAVTCTVPHQMFIKLPFSSSNRPNLRTQSLPTAMHRLITVTNELNNLLVYQRSELSSSEFPLYISTLRPTSSSSAPHKQVSNSIYLKFHPFYVHLQAQRARIRLSRCLVMDPLVRSGSVIGMGPYPPIHHYHLCSAALQGQNGLESVWQQSKE